MIMIDILPNSLKQQTIFCPSFISYDQTSSFSLNIYNMSCSIFIKSCNREDFFLHRAYFLEYLVCFEEVTGRKVCNYRLVYSINARSLLTAKPEDLSVCIISLLTMYNRIY